MNIEGADAGRQARLSVRGAATFDDFPKFTRLREAIRDPDLHR